MTHEHMDMEARMAFEDAMPDEEILYDLADLFKVFSDTTRIKILYSLMSGERRVADIAERSSSSIRSSSGPLWLR